MDLGGNHGDILVREGSKELADEVGLEYRLFHLRAPNFTPPKIQPNEVIYLQPGAYNRVFHETLKAFWNTRKACPDNLFVHGPSTVEPEWCRNQKFPSNSSKVIWYSRERTTHDYMMNLYDNAFLDEDVSLHLTLDKPRFRGLIGKTRIQRKHRLLVRNYNFPDVKYPVRVEDYDIVEDPTNYSLKHWLNVILKASAITSNRLHTIMLGLIAEKKNLAIYNTFFHKNKSVWEYSLKARGVKWAG